jgi:uncharacterized protein with HEPN domain
MTNTSRLRLEEYLLRVIEIVDETAAFLGTLSEDAFVRSLVVVRATERNIEIIGELLHQIEILYPSFAEAHDEMPFRLAYDMRNLLAHTYWRSEAEVIWETATVHVPSLRPLMAAALASL